MSLIDKNLTAQTNQESRISIIKKVEALTGRRLICYVTALNRENASLTSEDKTGFSDLLEGVDGDGIDVLVNSPGGFAEVTESIVGMLRSKYKSVRFVIPNSAKSAATLLALSGDAILMDARSELGPIDPQVSYMTRQGPKREAAEAIIEGFNAAKEAVKKEGAATVPAYIPLLENYSVGLLQACANAKKLSETLALGWLSNYMFAGDDSDRAAKVTEYFASHKETLSHGRAIRIDTCERLEMNVINLDKEEHRPLRDLIWSLWCHYELHLERAPMVTKLYENSSGCTVQKQSAQFQIIMPNPGVLPGLPGGPPVGPKRPSGK